MLSVYIGTHLGKKLLGYIPERTFKMIFKISLTIIAIKLIFDATLLIRHLFNTAMKNLKQLLKTYIQKTLMK